MRLGRSFHCSLCLCLLSLTTNGPVVSMAVQALSHQSIAIPEVYKVATSVAALLAAMSDCACHLACVASWTLPWLPQEPYKQQLEPMLVRYVLPTFGSPAGHLRAKAAWVAGQFADIRFRERPGEGALLPRGAGATFQGLFQSVLGLLRDADLPVSCLMTRDTGRQQTICFCCRVLMWCGAAARPQRYLLGLEIYVFGDDVQHGSAEAAFRPLLMSLERET